jgi:hypothetical protein
VADRPERSCQADGAVADASRSRRLVYCLAVDEEVVPVLYVEDAARAVAWYGRLGFVKAWEQADTLIHLYIRDIDAVSEEFGVPSMKKGSPGASAT